MVGGSRTKLEANLNSIPNQKHPTYYVEENTRETYKHEYVYEWNQPCIAGILAAFQCWRVQLCSCGAMA